MKKEIETYSMFFKAAINPGHNELLETSCEPRDLGEFI
jgi:hypothetical protein